MPQPSTTGAKTDSPATLLDYALFHLEADQNKRSPFASYQYVNVTFPTGANTDVAVVHSLRTDTPSNIRFLVADCDRAVRVYRDRTATAKTWTSQVIYLRADVASAVCRLLLFVERQ